VISTAVITVFGEILPQAICSRHALWIGAHASLIVNVFMVGLCPISWPISTILDFFMGEEIGTIYSNRELSKLVELHASHKKGELEDVEAKILGGALDFAKKTVGQIMTPVEKIFMLEESAKLDQDTITQIWLSGRSRIPVFGGNRDNIVGLILAKDLILVNPEEELPLHAVMTFYGRNLVKVFPDAQLNDLLNIFKTGKAHIAIVHDVKSIDNKDPYYITVGLVTLEDVIEEIIRDEIRDESEVRVTANLGSGKNKVIRLTPQQVIAVGSYLKKTLDCFKQFPDDLLFKLLGMSQVDTYEPKEGQILPLYQKGKESTVFSMILSGGCSVTSGKEKFMIERGQWTTLGLRALTAPIFVVDFDAVITKTTKVLVIQRQEFVGILHELYKEKDFPSQWEWAKSK
jgi:metal transporter CNNM